MAMTDVEKRAYARGYYRGSSRWPEHRPPVPPHDVVGGLIVALQSIRDECDSFIATLDEVDEVAIKLGEQVDRANDALSAVSQWLKDSTP